jgi:protein phosphatase
MLESCGLSDPGRVRANNEDYFLIAPSLGLYIVADGLEENALTAAFEEANRCVSAASASAVELQGMGTTLVAALARGEDIRIASVGDSRVYIFEDGALQSITEDQTWVNDVGRRLGLDEAALKVHPFRHVVTMAIGVSSPLQVRTYAVRPRVGTVLLLCSDGLHGVIGDNRIAAVLSGYNDLDHCARGLIEAAREAGGPDNITVILLRFGYFLSSRECQRAATRRTQPLPDGRGSVPGCFLSSREWAAVHRECETGLEYWDVHIAIERGKYRAAVWRDRTAGAPPG